MHRGRGANSNFRDQTNFGRGSYYGQQQQQQYYQPYNGGYNPGHIRGGQYFRTNRFPRPEQQGFTNYQNNSGNLATFPQSTQNAYGNQGNAN